MSATTPYRANVAAHQSSYQTPSRRALGELTPRAINSPSTHSGDSESSQAIQARSQLKKVTSHIPSVFADKENLLASVSSHGKKRSIDEVDDVEKAGGAKMLAHGRDASLWESGMRLTTQAMQQHTVRRITMTTRRARADPYRKTILLVWLTRAHQPSATRLRQNLNQFKPRRRATHPFPTFSTMSFVRARRANTQEKRYPRQHPRERQQHHRNPLQGLALRYCARDSSLGYTRSKRTKKTRRAWT